MAVRLGLKTYQMGSSYEEILRAWQEAEDAGFESLWLFDHFIPTRPDQTCMEAWTLLAALATQVERVRFGVMVALVGYRHPAILANMAATVDVITGGRLEVGLGAGSQFARIDCDRYGIPYPSYEERIAQLEETCQVLQKLWTQGAVEFQGEFYRLQGARCGIRPEQQPHPPIIAGGSSRRVLEIAARHAQGWNYSGEDPIDFGRRAGMLDELCRAYGREPGSVEKSVQVFLRAVPEAQLVALLQRFTEAGAGRIILIPDPPYEPGMATRLARQVLPVLA